MLNIVIMTLVNSKKKFVQCWPTVCDAGLTANQPWVNVSVNYCIDVIVEAYLDCSECVGGDTLLDSPRDCLGVCHGDAINVSLSTLTGEKWECLP